jgi:hypothetical protein
VQRTLLDGLVEHRDCRAIELQRGCLVAFFDAFAQVAQCGTQAGGVGAVGGGALRGLAGAFQRRKMICHVCFVTFVSQRDIRVGPNSLL